MMGTKERCFAPLIDVSLEELVPHIKDIYLEVDFLYRTHLSTDRELVVDGVSPGFYSSETRTGLTRRTAAAAKDAPLLWLSPALLLAFFSWM